MTVSELRQRASKKDVPVAESTGEEALTFANTPSSPKRHPSSEKLERTSSSKAREKSPRSAKREEVVWGKTPGGQVFRVPTTHDVLTLFHPSYPKSHFDILNLTLLGLQIVLYMLLPLRISRPFFLFYFAFWRMAYDAGLGWVLTRQSKRKWIVREVQRLGWLDEERNPEMKRWIRKQLVGKMGKDYSFDELPVEYNTWLLFRQLVDVILLNDFVAYCMFAFACFRVPSDLNLGIHILRWIGGITLIAFNLWVKTEAHHVVKDYGWYWGDAFFQRGALVFDGVFELAPHPMYSVGYAGYYGLSLIVGSYAVLFVSLAAHAAQFGFLLFFENPHIQRMYGQQKLLASRTPILQQAEISKSPQTPKARSKPLTTITDNVDILSTPTSTEGETASETDLDTETETECECDEAKPQSKRPIVNGTQSQKSSPAKTKVISQHDLQNRYFRNDTIMLHNLDMFRASDFMLVVAIFYALSTVVIPHLSHRSLLIAHFTHALLWRLFHTFGLGLLLQAQSKSRYLVRHFLKHYHYPDHDSGKGAVLEAFANWKQLYNLSLCMTYTSFVGLAWNTYKFPTEWAEGDQLLRHTMGVLLIALHVWAALESYEVLGVFGWFFGDFFIEDYPMTVEYTGIYRFLNNPEIMSGAAFFGVALISGSKFVIAMAVISCLSYWWFLRNVENPHMRKLYGDSLRKDAGFTKIIKKVAVKNARLLESRAGRHAPEIRRVAQEVKGSFDKVIEETAEAVEEFLNKSRPKISEVMQDTKVLLQQSREKLVITRVANDISHYNSYNYNISVVTSRPDGKLRFHLGEAITVKWSAPAGHSRRDWVGIYRVGANKSTSITNVSSLGMWVPVHDDEWDGDIPLGFNEGKAGRKDENGTVTFKGDSLPWQVGAYELRYHHDGKYNVMCYDGPMEIYVDPPSSLTFDSVRSYLMQIVTLCLDSDPSLVPLSSKVADERMTVTGEGRDADDFRFWSERQAKRIAISIKQAFDVEYAQEVIIAEANITALTHRILVSKKLMAA